MTIEVSMTNFADMEYHPTSEKLVDILRAKTQRNDHLFFRLMVAYYWSLAASQMRCSINTPDSGLIPVNMYALALAPSGYGKTTAANFMEENVLSLFRGRFLSETFPIMGEANIPKIANKRAMRNGTDPDEEMDRVQKEFDRLGPLLFSFDSGTGPAVKQMRHKLLMANAGSLNLIMDEVGTNLSGNMEVFDTFIELYDKGKIKQKLIKHTADNARSEEIVGQTPANLLMFGVPQKLFDGAKTEDDFMSMLAMGYARRCFFAYVRKSDRKPTQTPEQRYADRTNKSNDQYVEQLAEKLENLADLINANKQLVISESTYIKLFEYQMYCEAQSDRLPEHQEVQKRELSERSFKVLKLAGAYAFIDDSPEVTVQHIQYAIKLAEDSGNAFNQLLSRDKNWVKLAKYIAAVGSDITQADLAEDLPFYKGTNQAKQEMMNLAIAYGYKNNIIIKKSFVDGIEFLRGESLQETDLNRMIISYSDDIVTGYNNDYAPFDKLHLLTQKAGMHWVAHHLNDGYRNEENCIAGFNLAVIDVDGGTSIQTVKNLLKNCKYLLYTTKRHTEEENRFRLIFPMNYRLDLDAKDYKEFMSNLCDWLPFEVDRQASQRARKWMSNDGHYEYNDGELLDVLPFIPKTSKNEERKSLLQSQQSLDNLQRWVMNNTGDGNRNNMLLRYAMILVDAGKTFEEIRSAVLDLNNKITDKLDEAEIMGTIMVTVARTLSKQ